MKQYHKTLYALNISAVALGGVSACMMLQVSTAWLIASVVCACLYVVMKWVFMSKESFTDMVISYKLRPWYLWIVSIGAIVSEYGMGIMFDNMALIGIGIMHMITEAVWFEYIDDMNRDNNEPNHDDY